MLRLTDNLAPPSPGGMKRSPSSQYRESNSGPPRPSMKNYSAKPKSWSANDYKEMKHYFMNWYIEVLKNQHELEHTKVTHSTKPTRETSQPKAEIPKRRTSSLQGSMNDEPQESEESRAGSRTLPRSTSWENSLSPVEELEADKREVTKKRIIGNCGNGSIETKENVVFLIAE